VHFAPLGNMTGFQFEGNLRLAQRLLSAHAFTVSSLPSSQIQPAQQDHAQWFAEEVHPHGSQLKAYVRGSFPALRGDADDVVQESFLRIWQARTAQPIQSAKAFLYKVAKHIALDSLRHQRRSPIDAVSNLDALDVLVDSPAAADAGGLQDKIEILTDLIAALPARRREIILLCKFRRFSAQEAADHLGLDRRTVENQLYRAIRQCETQLRARGIQNLYGDEKR